MMRYQIKPQLCFNYMKQKRVDFCLETEIQNTSLGLQHHAHDGDKQQFYVNSWTYVICASDKWQTEKQRVLATIKPCDTRRL